MFQTSLRITSINCEEKGIIVKFFTIRKINVFIFLQKFFLYVFYL